MNLARIYQVSIVLALALYGLAGFKGWRVSPGERDHVEATVRSSPGGYRSFHFWHSGFSGGK